MGARNQRGELCEKLHGVKGKVACPVAPRRLEAGEHTSIGPKGQAVFASATTWTKLARQRGWRRPRRRVYPEKPKTGIRATHPNEYWHIDVTVIRLLDDTKAYLHAIIDNFSRRILSWRLAERLDPNTTCEILKEAGKNLDRMPTVVADSGVENVNARVEQLMTDGLMHRVLAQVEVGFSNSMVEAFWRSLRHQWLYLHSLDSFTQLEQLIEFYVREHNTQMNHVARAAHHPLANPSVLSTPSQMRRRDARMFADAAALRTLWKEALAQTQAAT